MAKKRSKAEGRRIVGFVGIGLDGSDGDVRLTRSEHFLLVGGSPETHERMQDTAIRVQEGLERRGKPLPELPLEEVLDLFRKADQ